MNYRNLNQEDLKNKIFCLALSSENDNLRIKKLEDCWNEILDEKSLLRLAKIDEVQSHIAYLLKKSNLKFSKLWIEEYFLVKDKVDILMDTLESVSVSLSKHNIKVIALKNSGITKGIYKFNGCSPMGDLDILISITDFKKAHNIITKTLGFNFKFRSELEDENLDMAIRNGGTEYFKVIKGNTIWLELQWRPISGRWIQPHSEPNGDDLIDRAIRVKDSSVYILSPEDNLLQVALHTAKHSYVRSPGFRLHSDVDRIVRFQKINWSKFVRRSVKLKVKTAVYFSLYYSNKLLNTPIPNSVLSTLKPNFIRNKIILYLIQKAGITNQKERKFTNFTYIVFNLALYDSILEIFQAVFPPFYLLQKKYNIKNKWQTPYYYLIRIRQLIFNRENL